MSSEGPAVALERFSPSADPAVIDPKPKYRSWKKKYRKMRAIFEQKMKESDQLFKEEQNAVETSRRLAEEKDQLLDILLDLNNSIHISVEQRFDLGSPSSNAELLPEDANLDVAARRSPPPTMEGSSKKPSRATPRSKVDASTARRPPTPPYHLETEPKSFRALLKVAHSRTLSIADTYMAEELCQSPPPPAYLSSSQEDEYLYVLDTALGASPSTNPFTSSTRPLASLSDREKDREHTLRNPVSVYNWLRRYQPQVFLQDNEGIPEKTGAKSSRGAGKRASAAAAKNMAEPPPLDFNDNNNNSMTPHRSIADPAAPPTGSSATKGGKRKRDEDGGYRPKGGSGGSRPAKRKREGDSGSAKKSKKVAVAPTNGA